jgi:hypothetical protein
MSMPSSSVDVANKREAILPREEALVEGISRLTRVLTIRISNGRRGTPSGIGLRGGARLRRLSVDWVQPLGRPIARADRRTARLVRRRPDRQSRSERGVGASRSIRRDVLPGRQKEGNVHSNQAHSRPDEGRPQRTLQVDQTRKSETVLLCSGARRERGRSPEPEEAPLKPRDSSFALH